MLLSIVINRKIMDCSISFLFLVVVLLARVAHAAAVTPQEYWEVKLPNTRLPSAIRDLLRPDVGIHPEIMASSRIGNDLRGKIKYDLMPSNMHGMPDEDVWFLEDAILPGRTVVMNFTRAFRPVSLLPRGEASTIPFSSAELPALLRRFSLRPNSAEADSLRITLEACEMGDPVEKLKFCATSLESAVDFVTSNFGTHDVWAVSTEVARSGAAIKQEYVVASAPKLTLSRSIACHAAPYPYAVFYCHVTSDTRAWVVPLVGKDGTKVDAVAVCHDDTSTWNPSNFAFKMLNVKPGTVPLCHFLIQGAVLWAPRNITAGSLIN